VKELWGARNQRADDVTAVCRALAERAAEERRVDGCGAGGEAEGVGEAAGEEGPRRGELEDVHADLPASFGGGGGTESSCAIAAGNASKSRSKMAGNPAAAAKKRGRWPSCALRGRGGEKAQGGCSGARG
jgi:hypothetical protein